VKGTGPQPGRFLRYGELCVGLPMGCLGWVPTPSGRSSKRPASAGRGRAVGARPARSNASAKVGRRSRSSTPMPRLRNLIGRAYREGERVKRQASRCGESIEPVRSRRCPIPARAGNRGANRHAPAAPALEGWHSQAHESVPSGHGRGSGQRSAWLHQRRAAPLARGAIDDHPQNFAAASTTAQPRGEPSGVEKLAGGAYGEGDTAGGAAAFEDVGGFGQP
jgi:hypothetical protein